MAELKNIILLFILFSFCTLDVSGQDAKEILLKAREKCNNIAAGYYEYTKSVKLPARMDTAQTSYGCYFRRLPLDTVLPMAFHCRSLLNGQPEEDIMYTGQELIEFLPGNDLAISFNKATCAHDINARQRDFRFYPPFSGKDRNPIPSEKDLSGSEYEVGWYGEETILGTPCFHILVTKYPDANTKEELKTFRIDYHFWIQKDSFIPIQYSVSHTGILNNNNLTQYEKYILINYEFDKPVDEKQFTRQSIPPKYQLKEYTPDKKPAALFTDSVAPDWMFRSVNGKTITLSRMNGNLVLVEFFYKQSPGCILALPDLQHLYKRYKRLGVKVVGIDIYGKKDKKLRNFLLSLKVSYPVLLGDKNVADSYHVKSFPSLIVVNATGKIIYRYEGHQKQMIEDIEKVIKANL